MKTTILACTLLLGCFASAQTRLTYGQVYNFNIGDVVQSIYYSSAAQNGLLPTYQTSTVLSKSFSPHNDTIFYQIRYDYYTPPACATCSATTGSAMNTQTVTNLYAFVPNTNNSTCLPVADTLYYAYCNRRTYEVFTKSDPNCFEPLTEITTYVEGVGQFYYVYDPKQSPVYFDKIILNYYIKQSVSCPLGTNIRENTPGDCRVFPNPASAMVTVAAMQPVLHVAIFSVEGKMVAAFVPDENKVDVSALQKGTYIMNVLLDDRQVRTFRIVKQ